MLSEAINLSIKALGVLAFCFHASSALAGNFDDARVQSWSRSFLIAGSTNQKTVSLVINGYGKSPTEALQNAAENALKQVVGSFLSAETLVNKKTVIQNGITSTTRVIQKDISEYSQGAIKSIYSLNISRSDGLYFAVARVEVRVEDFRRFIDKIASDSVEIGANLYAQISANMANQSGLVDSVEKQLLPIIKGRGSEVSVGSPMLISSLPQSYKQLVQYFDESTTIALPFSISIPQAVWSSIESSLDSLATAKSVSFAPFNFDLLDNRNLNGSNQDRTPFVLGLVDPDRQRLIAYQFKNFWVSLKKKYGVKYGSQSDSQSPLFGVVHPHSSDTIRQRGVFYPRLLIELLASDGSVIYSKGLLSFSRPSQWRLGGVDKLVVLCVPGRALGYDGELSGEFDSCRYQNSDPWGFSPFHNSSQILGSRKFLVAKQNYLLLMSLPPEQRQLIRDVRITLVD